MEAISEESLELEKQILEIKQQIDVNRHIFRMEELAFERENNKIMHEQILERGRISRAEERKMLLERRSLKC